MHEFEYIAPESLSDLESQLKSHAGGKILAGGMSLLSAMKLRLNSPSHLIDLRRLGELRGIVRSHDELVIGAMTRHAEVADSDLVNSTVPALGQLAAGIGDRQVRNRGTIGGSLANSDPAACYPAGLVGIGGVVETNRRSIDSDSFFKGLFETALHPEEIICRIRFRIPRRAAYAKFKQPASRFAMVGVMVSQSAEGSFRVGVTGAKAHAYREPLIESALNATGEGARIRTLDLPRADYNSDMHADSEYRRHLVLEMAAQAAEQLFRQP